MTKDTTNTSDISRTRHLLDCFNFGSINFNASFRDLVSKNNPFINHEMAFLPVKNKVGFFTSLQNFIKVVQTVIKRSSIGRKIVHENLYNFLHKNHEK